MGEHNNGNDAVDRNLIPTSTRDIDCRAAGGAAEGVKESRGGTHPAAGAGSRRAPSPTLEVYPSQYQDLPDQAAVRGSLGAAVSQLHS